MDYTGILLLNWAIARRGMNFSERLPRPVSAYLGVNPRKHVWGAWYQFNMFVGRCSVVNRRHDYYPCL